MSMGGPRRKKPKAVATLQGGGTKLIAPSLHTHTHPLLFPHFAKKMNETKENGHFPLYKVVKTDTRELQAVPIKC